ncbi:MAG: hypothetical protein CL582_22415 [Alteromonadaceae bacterium]|nr:hypothetical protein [Alteromonadaceae bacterium]
MKNQLEMGTFNFDDIERNADGFQNCRKANAFDVENLRESIKKEGLLNPPIVRVYKDGDGKMRVVLLAGYRRYQAIYEERNEMREKGEDTSSFYDEIRCSIFHGSLNDAQARNLSENMQRQTLNKADTMEAISKLCESVGTQEEVAVKLSISQAQVSILTSTYYGLCTEVFEALRNDRIRLNQAKKLAKVLNPDGSPDIKEQTELLEEILTTKGRSVLSNGTERKRAKTYRSKGEVEELRMTLAQIPDDDIDMEHRQSVMRVLRWYSCEIDTEEVLYSADEDAEMDVYQEIAAPVVKKRRNNVSVNG